MKTYLGDRPYLVDRSMGDERVIDFPGQFKAYFENGRMHRDDGPAAIYYNGRPSEWAIKGVIKTEEEVLQYAIDAGNKDAVKNIIWRKY